MARTIVYQPEATTAVGLTRAAGGNDAPEPIDWDGYAAKLVKLVPAEVIGFFVPFAAYVEGRQGLLYAGTFAGLICTPLYLRYIAHKLPEKKRPKWSFYVLSTVAFVAWAVGTSNLGTAVGLDDVERGSVLLIAVLVLPLIDKLLTDTRSAG